MIGTLIVAEAATGSPVRGWFYLHAAVQAFEEMPFPSPLEAFQEGKHAARETFHQERRYAAYLVRKYREEIPAGRRRAFALGYLDQVRIMGGRQ